MKKSLSLLFACIFVFSLIIPARAKADVVLEIGSRGENVTKVQKRLIQYGYLTGTADGKYGEKTRSAVEWFQRRNGLAVDGRVGKKTAAALGVTLTGGQTSSSTSASIVSSDHRLLAKLVYAEARGESYKGQVAVAAVTLNRVASSSFPNTLTGVVYQSGAYSCVSNGSINNTPDSTAIKAALEALNGWDPTNGCLYYYNPRLTNDKWIKSRPVITVIGNHNFAK
ncbi:MAG: spore cortex-lytic enzyme [Clostridia bacterium]|nr:spore cortex-lytic enzyme [Clostridia bacterium]